jgi:hypothetical protein
MNSVKNEMHELVWREPLNSSRIFCECKKCRKGFSIERISGSTVEQQVQAAFSIHECKGGIVNGTETASEALKLIMGSVQASLWKKEPHSSDIIISAFPTKDAVHYLVNPSMLKAADKFLDTKVPPFRGEIDPIRLDTRSKHKGDRTGKSGYK